MTGEVKSQKFYHYIAIDRFCYLEAFEEHSTYSSALFLKHLIKAFPFPIECVQTDNGTEFIKWLLPTECGIRYKLIRPYTPRRNGEAGRSHRKDNEYFYTSHTFYSFDDFKKQLAVHSRKCSKFPMRPLYWKSPADYIKSFKLNGEFF